MLLTERQRYESLVSVARERLGAAYEAEHRARRWADARTGSRRDTGTRANVAYVARSSMRSAPELAATGLPWPRSPRFSDVTRFCAVKQRMSRARASGSPLRRGQAGSTA
jgi:hypothetical protein